jgi:hypothetical protein
MVYTTRHKI